MQLQGTKISNKGQQDQQKQKHPKQQQQAEKSTRQQQSSACTMGHGNPEEAPESFARSLRSLEKQPTTALGPRNARCARVAQRDNDAKNIKKKQKRKTAYNSPGSAQQRPKGSQTLPKPSQNLPQTLPKPSLNTSQMLQNFDFFTKSLKMPKRSQKRRDKLPTSPPKPSPNPAQIPLKSIKKPSAQTHEICE